MPDNTGALGFGGFFFRSDDPDKLAQWYEKALGINQANSDSEQEPWFAQSGPLVFQPFDHDSDMLANSRFGFMLNFRVADLDATVNHLRNMGSDVQVDPETYSYGRFAELKDPEGNPIQLWQPE